MARRPSGSTSARPLNHSDPQHVSGKRTSSIAKKGRVFEDSRPLETTASASVTGIGEPERVQHLAVTDGTLKLLRVNTRARPHVQRRRRFAKTPERVILSHAYWQRKFGSDPTSSAIGRRRRPATRDHRRAAGRNSASSIKHPARRCRSVSIAPSCTRPTSASRAWRGSSRGVDARAGERRRRPHHPASSRSATRCRTASRARCATT